MIFKGNHTVGRGRARTLGFPTINLHNINTVTIEEGVYAVHATINHSTYDAAMFVGDSPTFKDSEQSVEIHLIDIDASEIKKRHLDKLIASPILVETIQYIRPVMKFKSRDDLIRAIKNDVIETKKILA